MKKNTLSLVGVMGVLVIASLVIATWRINFWPTDAEDFYIDAAKSLPTLKYISQVHESMDQVKIKWLHGKEICIIYASLFLRQVSSRTFIFCLLSITL